MSKIVVRGGDTQQTINSVTITGATANKEYLGGTSVTLKAKVDGPSGAKVNWTSSNEDVATVKNGTVTFKNVSSLSEVKITATSKDDSTKSDSVTLKVKHNMIDISSSKENADYTDYDNNGILTEVGDTGLVFADVYSTKWYVEASIAVQEYIDPSSDGYPKFGLMTTTHPGEWNGSNDTKIVKNGFFYLDANKDTQNNATSFNFVVQNDTHTDWDWGNQLGGFNVSSSDGIKKDDYFRIGLLRDGIDYYLYTKKGEKIDSYKHIVYDDIGAEEKSYAMLAGWGVGYYAKDFIAYQGDDVNALFADATKLELTSNSQVMYINETYQIGYDLGVINYNPELFEFTSSDTDIVTVDSRGLVTAGETTGEAKISVKYGTELTAKLSIIVTDDPKYNVVLDGKMDDAIYTENAKNSPIIVRNSNHQKTTIWGSRNSRGIYLIVKDEADYDYSSASNWWEGNNAEFRFNGESGLLTNEYELKNNPSNKYQYWASRHANTGSNFTDQYISSLTKNEETGKYELTYELFASYEYLGLTNADENTKVGFTYGSNLGGIYWANNAHWTETDYNVTIHITNDGLVCSGHEGDWTEKKAVNCKKDGIEERTCTKCGHYETRTVTTTGEHNWNLTDIEITEASTCTSKGKGVVHCHGKDDGCTETKEIELPLDHTNHTGTYVDGKYTCCTEIVEQNKPIVYDHYNAGGWKENIGYLVKGLEGDFKVVVNFDHYANNSEQTKFGDYCWRSVLPVVQDGTIETQGACWVARMDWCGWVDKWNSENNIGTFDSNNDYRLERWHNGDDDLFKAILAESNITITFTRTGNVIREDMAIVHNNITYNYWIQLKEVTSNKINLALSAEYAKVSINSIYTVE